MNRINESGFFQDQVHLEFLVQKALPELIRSFGYGIRKRLTVWSVGCNSGEEPYTLAMVLSEFAERYPGLGFHFLVLATEISMGLLQVARAGIYEERLISPVPMEMRKKYLLKSRDPSKGLVRIAPELRETVKFRAENSGEAGVAFREPMDIIFCRQALLGVDRYRQEGLLRHFYQHLVPGGFLFMGQLQDLGGLNLPLVAVAPTVYRKLAQG